MLKLCEWPPPGWAQCCRPCKASKLKYTVGGIPKSIKQVKLAPPNEVGPSKDALELELGEEAASEESKAPPAGLAELEGMIRAQTAMLQSQLTTQEWLAGKLECVAIVLNRHHAVMEELLVALTSMGCGFGAGLGAGLDSWAEMVPRREWGRIRVTREEVSEDEYE